MKGNNCCFTALRKTSTTDIRIRSDSYRPIKFKLDMLVDTSKRCVLIAHYMTLTLIQELFLCDFKNSVFEIGLHLHTYEPIYFKLGVADRHD